MNICGYYPESINEGLGLRSVVFIAGCKHNCKGCCSPQTHSFDYGELFTIEKQQDIIQKIKTNLLLDGITLCGGDVFYSAKEVLGFIEILKKEIQNVNIWSYTGFTYEQILNSNDEYMIGLLKECDVIIDGRFDENLKDLTLPFKGSTNQRIIDIKESLIQNKVITLKI